NGFTVVRIRGKDHRFPAAEVADSTVVVFGKAIRVASVKDELFKRNPVGNPELFVAKLKESGLRADVFTFSQKPPDVGPRYNYLRESDNFAAIHRADFNSWWDRLPQETRKNVRRASNRGVVVKVVELTDDFVLGVMEIYDESPIRQGKPFHHY